MKVHLKNPVMVNHSHHRDLEIDDKFVEFGTYHYLYNKVLDDETIPDDAIYMESDENEEPTRCVTTVGECRENDRKQKEYFANYGKAKQ